MNIIDKAVGILAPEAALRRVAARKTLSRLTNTGYSHGGASRSKTSMKGWPWHGGSTKEDIELNLPVGRQRCRDLYMNAPIARSIINRKSSNVIGGGLRPRFIPDADVLGITPEEAVAWGRKTEREFLMWAESTESDALGMLNFFENQYVAFANWMLNGDAIGVLGMDQGVTQPYELRVHLIEADRVCNPMNLLNDPAYRDGVEIDPESGKVLAYHVRSVHPLAKSGAALNWKSTRIPVRGAGSGRLNIVHLLTTERAEQYRGVPLLLSVVEHIKQLSRYSEAELMAAVISAFYTVFIKTPEAQTAMFETAAKPDGSGEAKSQLEDQLSLGPGAIQLLQDGEEIDIANPGRPNAQYAAFVDALLQEIGAATDVPCEILMLKFNTSYTAARAAVVEFAKSVSFLRSRMSARFCSPIAYEWMDEAVLTGRVKAPGYFDDPLIRNAWRRIQWNGPGMGQINSIVEVKAATMRIEAGLSTFAKEAQELSSMSLDDIIPVQADERTRMAVANIPIALGKNQPGPPQQADGSTV